MRFSKPVIKFRVSFFLFKILFIYSLETQRDRDISRGRSRLPVGNCMRDSIPGPEPKADAQPLSHPGAPLLNPLNNPMKSVLLLSSIYWGGNGYTERLSNWLRITQFISGGAKMGIWVLILRQCCNTLGYTPQGTRSWDQSAHCYIPCCYHSSLYLIDMQWRFIVNWLIKRTKYV